MRDNPPFKDRADLRSKIAKIVRDTRYSFWGLSSVYVQLKSVPTPNKLLRRNGLGPTVSELLRNEYEVLHALSQLLDVQQSISEWDVDSHGVYLTTKIYFEPTALLDA